MEQSGEKIRYDRFEKQAKNLFMKFYNKKYTNDYKGIQYTPYSSYYDDETCEDYDKDVKIDEIDKTRTFERVLDLEGSCSTVERTVIIASCLQESNPNDTPYPGGQPWSMDALGHPWTMPGGSYPGAWDLDGVDRFLFYPYLPNLCSLPS